MDESNWALLMCAALIMSATSPAQVLPQTRLPYMAEYKVGQIGSGGKSEVLQTTEDIAIDSRGRRMTAITRASGPVYQPRTHFTVVDPVAHTVVTWNSSGTEAAVWAMPLSGPIGCSYNFVFTTGPNIMTKVEDLGTNTIAGVEARGQRTTRTMPPRRHQKTPVLVDMVEVWRATDPGLRGLVVRYANYDFAMRPNMTKELVSFRQGEPPAFLFKQPPGYTAVNHDVLPHGCVETGESMLYFPPSQ